MTTSTPNLFFALLTLLSLAAIAGLAVVGLRGRTAGRTDLQDTVGTIALPLAWIVAVVATLGSLYESEMLHFTPCKLCWFQRIAMYPMAVTLGIAAFRRDRGIRPYALATCAIGGAIALYHSFLQWFPPEGGSSFCTVDAPCTERYVYVFGFVSIPFMALTAFALIAALTLSCGPPESADPFPSSEPS